MSNRSRRLALASAATFAAALAIASATAYAQGGGTSAHLFGVVSDTAGRIVSGTVVVVRNNATSAECRAITDHSGLVLNPC